MRILLASVHQSIVGGIETYLRDMLPALQHHGHELALVFSAASVDGAALIGQYVSEIPSWRVFQEECAETFRQIEAWRPDVVFLHGLDSPESEEALLASYPTVLFAHGHGGTCISGTRTFSFPVYQPCEKKFGPACLFHYYPRRCGGLNPLTMLDHYRIGKRRQRLLARYQAVIVASTFLVEEYRRHGVPEERLHRVPLFPTDVVPGCDGPASRAFRDRILLVGRLYRLKGACLLVEAIRYVKDELSRSLTLVVAGDGPDKSRMESLAARFGVSIEFHGWVDSEKRTALMRDADLLAVPSVCPETFGLVGVEAGCVGLPAVGFAVGGIPDWLLPGQSGELAPGNPPTAKGLAEAIVRALVSPTHWRRLSLGAWETARQFSREVHVSRVEAILEQVVRQASQKRSGREATLSV